MWLLALALIVGLFGGMAAVFGRQERAERRRMLVEAALALELDGMFDTAALDGGDEWPAASAEDAVVRAV